MRGCVSVSRPLVTCLACSDSGFLHYYYYFYFVLYLCIVHVGWVFLGAFSLLDFYCGNANVGRFLKPPQHPLTHTSTHLGLARILSLVVWVRVCVLFVRVAQHLHENDEWFYGLLDLNFIVCMHAPPQPTAPHRPAHCEWKILCLHKKLDFCISYGNEKTSTWFVFHWFTRFARLLSLHSPRPLEFSSFFLWVCVLVRRKRFLATLGKLFEFPSFILVFRFVFSLVVGVHWFLVCAFALWAFAVHGNAKNTEIKSSREYTLA